MFFLRSEPPRKKDEGKGNDTKEFRNVGSVFLMFRIFFSYERLCSNTYNNKNEDTRNAQLVGRFTSYNTNPKKYGNDHNVCIDTACHIACFIRIAVGIKRVYMRAQYTKKGAYKQGNPLLREITSSCVLYHPELYRVKLVLAYDLLFGLALKQRFLLCFRYCYGSPGLYWENHICYKAKHAVHLNGNIGNLFYFYHI